jgi:hypothetical protein
MKLLKGGGLKRERKNKNMEQFTTTDQNEIVGRGTVFIVTNPQERDRGELNSHYLGSEVMINGQVYKVKGVESYTVPIIYKGMKIGLLV